MEIEMSWIPNFDVSVPRNEWYLLLKRFSIHLNPLSLFFNRFEKMSFCVVEIETSFNVFRNRNRYLLLSEKVFQFIWINWFFFFKFLEMRSWRMLRNDEKKEINGFYLNKIWKKTQNKLFVPTKKRWAFKIFWNWNEFDTKVWLQMKLSPSCCCWKAFVFIWVYWVFSKMSI